MSESLVWADLSPSQLQHLSGRLTTPGGKRSLAKFLNVDNFSSNPHHRILLELYYSVLVFAKDHDMSLEKTSTLLSVFKLNHFQAMQTPFLNVDESFAYFKKLLVKHSVHRPPYSIQIFTLQDLATITAFALDTYYRHFKLYKYSFTQKQVLDIRIKSDNVERAPAIPPLSEAQKLAPSPVPDNDTGEGDGQDGEADKNNNNNNNKEEEEEAGGEERDAQATAAAADAAAGVGQDSDPSAPPGEPTVTDPQTAPVATTERTSPSGEPIADLVEDGIPLGPITKVAVQAVKAQVDSLKVELEQKLKDTQSEVLTRLQEVESRRPKSSLKKR